MFRMSSFRNILSFLMYLRTKNFFYTKEMVVCNVLYIATKLASILSNKDIVVVKTTS